MGMSDERRRNAAFFDSAILSNRAGGCFASVRFVFAFSTYKDSSNLEQVLAEGDGHRLRTVRGAEPGKGRFHVRLHAVNPDSENS